MRKQPRITYYRHPQRRKQPNCSIVPWIVVSAFLVLCMFAWQRHVEDMLVDTDPVAHLSFNELLDRTLSEKQPKITLSALDYLYFDDKKPVRYGCGHIPKIWGRKLSRAC